MSVNRYLPLIIVITSVFSVIAGVAIINQNTETREKAATSQGSAMIELQPRDLEEGIPAGTAMSLKLSAPRIASPTDGIQIVATFTGVVPSGLTVTPTNHIQLDVAVNQLENVTGGKKLTLAYISKDPSQPLNTELNPEGLGTINFTAPQTKGTLTITFDPIRSIFAENASSQDVLATPETFSYYFLGGTPPSPLPSPTPTPSPSPSAPTNATPVIQTTSLSNATVGTAYSQPIIALDDNKDDTLTFTSTPLPTGLSIQNCTSTTANTRRRLLCYIAGTPTQFGASTIILTATDNHGASANKTYTLKINN